MNHLTAEQRQKLVEDGRQFFRNRRHRKEQEIATSTNSSSSSYIVESNPILDDVHVDTTSDPANMRSLNADTTVKGDVKQEGIGGLHERVVELHSVTEFVGAHTISNADSGGIDGSVHSSQNETASERKGSTKKHLEELAAVNRIVQQQAERLRIVEQERSRIESQFVQVQQQVTDLENEIVILKKSLDVEKSRTSESQTECGTLRNAVQSLVDREQREAGESGELLSALQDENVRLKQLVAEVASSGDVRERELSTKIARLENQLKSDSRKDRDSKSCVDCMVLNKKILSLEAELRKFTNMDEAYINSAITDVESGDYETKELKSDTSFHNRADPINESEDTGNEILTVGTPKSPVGGDIQYFKNLVRNQRKVLAQLIEERDRTFELLSKCTCNFGGVNEVEVNQ